VKRKLNHLLTEVKNAMHREDDTKATLSLMEGVLPKI